ncbi:Alpha/Beta hydrolase protein [Xylariomycetidae sp. FL2044]|nr:Alpha/Beta hydrolase protein [Xylariomycetidae sp. FL2044]
MMLLRFLQMTTSVQTLLVSPSMSTLPPLHRKKGVPEDPSGVTVMVSPNNMTVRYKSPGEEGLCETTPGVSSYSGFVDVDEHTHMFFWFLEARNDPDSKPITLWLNGGPGSDSLIGLFYELGPCSFIESSKTTQLNNYSWTEESNMLFLSQPIGVGFSYEEEVVGIMGAGGPEPSDHPDGRYGWTNASHFDTTELAAISAWEVVQAFIRDLPTMDETVQSRTFNLFTESYGGHYGPAFFSYFDDQNKGIRNGTLPGVELNMGSLGIINGLVSAQLQMGQYPEYAKHNTYGLSVSNKTYEDMKDAWEWEDGCKAGIAKCQVADRSTKHGQDLCAQASNYCRDWVESPFYKYAGRDPYDIRLPSDASDDYSSLAEFLNSQPVQEALGVNLNYTGVTGDGVFNGFDMTGDWSFPEMLSELEGLLSEGMSVHLIYGDADYICNWFGGEAVSLNVNYTHSTQFRIAGYAPFLVGGVEYGSTRQYGNFSFTRIYDSGHMVPSYQPAASLELFRRIINGLVVADGSETVLPDYDTEGTQFENIQTRR